MPACRPAAALAGALLCLAVATVPAHAHDSLAPRGAVHSWLPAHEEWVMQHWLPFDEVRLYEALQIDNRALEAWLSNDHNNIAQLAESRGLTADALADHLIAPRGASVHGARPAVLRERTMRVLTQGHLAQHILFHYFHGTYTLTNTRAIFGVGRKEYTRMRISGATPFQVGRRGRRTPRHVARGMRRILRFSAENGVRTGSHTPEQGGYMLRRRTTLLGCFLRRPMPKFDAGNPYGDPHNGHGRHSRGVRNGLRRDSKAVRARRHPRSCWREPALPSAASAPIAAGPLAEVRRPGRAERREALCHLGGI